MGKYADAFATRQSQIRALERKRNRALSCKAYDSANHISARISELSAINDALRPAAVPDSVPSAARASARAAAAGPHHATR
jgi:hypothetical protein